ncbi:hypothetical protein BC834DRAFT_837287, partial [Gloeopeniophorella convolvens]
TFIMDGNFTAEHMRARTSDDEVPLSEGTSFIAEPTRYKEHLSTANHKKIKSTCNTYRAIEMANSSHPHLDVTGIGATACAHGCFVPTSIVDFQKGERQANMDYSLCQALNYNMDGIPIAVILYDIMCQYCVNLLKRIDENALLSIPEALKLRYVIGLFHIHGHQDTCLARFSPSYTHATRQVDGEIIETLWSILNNISRSTRGMSLVHRAEVLDAHMNYSNWKKLIKTVPFMLKRWKRVQEGLPLSEVAFVGLSQRFPTMIGIWALQEADAQSHRWENPEAMDIYETKTKKAPTRSEVQTELSKQEKAWDSSNGEAQWISSGITIQETQYGPCLCTDRAIADFTPLDLELEGSFMQRREGSTQLIRRHLMIVEATYNPSSTSVRDGDDGSASVFPEDVNIMLPSTLGWTWCLHHGAKSLAVKEAKLRVAQAHDAIHKIRLALGFKSSLIRTRVRTAKSQKTKKSAWSSVHGVDAGVQEHARVYSLARDMFDVLEDALPSQESLPELTKADMKVQTLVLGSNEQEQQNEQLPWIWIWDPGE